MNIQIRYSGSPYRVETGGRLPNLRTSCCNEKIREFHSQFYHLNNMMLVVCGIIDHEKLLNIVSDVGEILLKSLFIGFFFLNSN